MNLLTSRLSQFHSVLMLMAGSIMGGFCEVSSATDRSDRAVHGPIELLQESLVQSADESRLLNAAGRLLQEGEQAQAFQALLEIFARPHDSFTPVIPDRPVKSTYDAALRLLLEADTATRTAWNETVQTQAQRALNNAMTGKSLSLRDVSRQYPLTRAGLDAMLTRAALASSQGLHQQASDTLAEIESIYGSVTLPFSSSSDITRLRHQLIILPKNTTTGFADQPNSPSPTELTLPWNRKLWQFNEDTWSHPETVGTLGGLMLPENRLSLTVNSWRPVLHNDLLIFRSPVSISAFDKLSGRRLWSVETDSERTAEERADEQQHLVGATRVSPRDLLKMSDFSSVTVSGDRLYFVDRFRRFIASPWSFQNAFRMGRPAGKIEDVPESKADGGTRLVAMQMTPEPRILWTAGSAADFDYPIEFPGVSQATNQAIDVLKSEADFGKQWFLGTPLVHGQRLYVLSSDRELVRLNCLSESTGRLLWQRPLLYEQSARATRPGRFMRQKQRSSGAAICGVYGKTIISALKNGVLVGTSVLDGQLKWATNVTDEQTRDNVRQRQMESFAGIETNEIGFSPRIHSGRIIWAAPAGSYVHCIDSDSGQIVWKVPRAIQSGGVAEGSRDEYAAAITENQVVLVGTRHVRALNLADGTLRWATSVQRQTGIATCNQETCLVPQQDGTIAAISIADGKADLLSQGIFQNSDDVVGSLAADDDVICAATPISLSVFPSAKFSGQNDSTGESRKDLLTDSRRLLLQGRIPEALTTLKQMLAAETSDNSRQESGRLAADVILRVLGEDRYTNVHPSDEFWELSSMLDSLPLSREQALKRMLLQPDAASVADLDTEDYPHVELKPGWNVRFDMAAWSSLSNDAALKLTDDYQGSDPQLRTIELSTQFPEHLGGTKAIQAYANELANAGNPAAAEMILLAAWNRSSDDQKPALENHVRKIRGQSVQMAEAVPLDTSLLTTSDIDFEQSLALTNDSRIAEILAAGKAVLFSPEWYRDRLFTVRRQLFSLDLDHGAVPLPARLPADIETDELPDTFEAPGILPIHDSLHVGAISLVDPEGPRLLWWKRLARPVGDASQFELGPIGPGYFVVSTMNRLFCLHPLTGAVLWQRDIHAAAPASNLFQRTARIFGDHRTIGLPGRNLQTCDVFRTSDGEQQQTIELAVPHGQIPLMSGRRILFQDNQRLVLKDILTGRDMLADKAPIQVMSGGQAKMLSDHRAIFISDKVEVIVLNMRTAEVEIKCAIGKHISEQRLTGLSAFERNHRLYVVVKDWGNPRARLSASSRMGEQRIDFGTLFCIDPTSAEVCWHIPAVPSVMPRIYGDPTSLLVTWSWKNPETQLWQLQLQGVQQREKPNSVDSQTSLIVRLIDGKTGRLIAEKHHLSPAEPIRCVHDRNTHSIRLESDKSAITIRYPEQSTQSQ